MCGRYTLFTEKEQQDIINIISQVQRKLDKEKLKTGEIYPTNKVPILTGLNQHIEPEAAVWGFPGFNGKGVIINARSETAAERRMFSVPLSIGRCVIPSTGFYEWDKEKTKYLFNLPDSDVLYMAGLFSEFKGERRFVILTTAANSSMQDTHHRIPLILPKDRINDWLFEESFALDYLSAGMPELLKKAW